MTHDCNNWKSACIVPTEVFGACSPFLAMENSILFSGNLILLSSHLFTSTKFCCPASCIQFVSSQRPSKGTACLLLTQYCQVVPSQGEATQKTLGNPTAHNENIVPVCNVIIVSIFQIYRLISENEIVFAACNSKYKLEYPLTLIMKTTPNYTHM